MSNDEMKKWLDGASYEELLRKWRFAPPWDPFFQGEMMDYFIKVMTRKRTEVGDKEHVRASKAIGW